MSRRESRRDSLANRQNDVLEEFETFKKKYLLVNKHIAKLNSSLNTKVEELSAQIASLNMENLRLRAAEQSMARKLHREKERTRRLVSEAEAAARTFITQFTSVLSSSSRPHSHLVPLSSASSHHRSSSASSTDPPSPSNPQPVKRPKAVKPPPKEVPRLSKAPQANTGQIQGINEDDEEGEADRTITLSTPPKKGASHRDERRHSLPTPGTPSDAPGRRRYSIEDDRTPRRTSTPPPPVVPLPPLIPKQPEGTFPPHIDLAAIGVSMRKSGVRRQSGLLNRFPPRANSAGANSASASVGDDLETKMKTLERLPPLRPPSPIIGSPKANAEKVAMPSASEDEVVTPGASASEMETDEWDDEIPPPILDFAAAIAQSERYASSYSKIKPKDRRSAVSGSGLGLGDVQPLDECKLREKEKGKSKDGSASLRDVTNEGAVSAAMVEARARKVVLLSERADRENKKRLASTAFDEDDHPTLPSTTTTTTTSSLQLPPRSATSSSSTVIVESYSVPLKDDAPSNVEESGRSRRQRSSVNYAEPSLKVKMRKPRVEGPVGLKTRKSEGDGLSTGYNSDGTGLVKERVKRKKSTKGLAELAAAASASESEHATPPVEASTTVKAREAELKQAAQRRLISYHVSPNSDSEAAGDEDEEYQPSSHGHAGTGGSISSQRRLGSASEGEGLRRWSVAC